MKIKHYNDIFEAIRYFEPNSPLLNLKENRLGYLKRDLSFNLIKMSNGKVSALPKNFLSPFNPIPSFYRGEDDEYNSCVPSIFRNNPTEEEILISKLKIIDFSLILKNHPKVKFAEKDGMDIYYDALAQHYELKTDLLDLTSDIVVAAFFATNTYDKETKSYVPKKEGMGAIWRYQAPEIVTGDLNNLELVGLQPFDRPGVQCAFGIKLKVGQDFSDLNNSYKILFKQNEDYSKKIKQLFCNQNSNKLLPIEDDVCDIAGAVKKSNSVSKEAIFIYCKKNNIASKKINNKIENKGYKIVDKNLYKLSRQRKRAIKRKIKNNPYGNVKLNVRFCCDSK